MRGGRWVEKNASEARGTGGGGRRGARAAERDSIADGTALRNIVGEEVAATLRDSGISLGLFFNVGYTTHLSS